MNKKEIILSLSKSFPDGVLYPETLLSIDNPDFLFLSQGRIFGCFVPTQKDIANPSSFLRRLYMSRLTYVQNLETIMISENASNAFLCSIQHSFNFIFESMPNDLGNMVLTPKKNETKRIKGEVQFHKDHISQYWRITEYMESNDLKNRRFIRFELPQSSPIVPNWGKNNKGLALPDSYNMDGSLLTNKSIASASIRESLDKLLNYQLFSSFDFYQGNLYYEQSSPHILNTDAKFILPDGSISKYGHALAYAGICPIAIQSISEFQHLSDIF